MSTEKNLRRSQRAAIARPANRAAGRLAWWVVTLTFLLPMSVLADDELVPVQYTASPWVEAALRHHVSPESLYSIALQESRRARADGTTRPWPWTLHTPQEGSLYFDSFEAARAKLLQLLTAGTNVDIGLLQVNWAYHGHRVEKPEQLLLPATNIDVGAQILSENLDVYGGDLRLALARYHSPRLERGLPYAASVLTILEYLRGAQAVRVALAQ